MAISGIAIGTTARPIENCVPAMMSVQSLQGEGTAMVASEKQASLAAGSPFGTASIFHSGAVIVACDAELFNLAELQRDISGETCAAVIAGLYLSYGEAFLNRLRGVFALAIWDRAAGTLLLARDRLGVRPLCYATASSEFIFASHPRGIFASGRLEKKVNYRALVEYLNYNVVPAPEMAYAGLKKVRPGESVVWKSGEVRTSRYWDLQYTEDADRGEERLAAELLSRIEEAVRVTSAGVEPAHAGCFLSGGTDSSTLLGLFTRLTKQPATAFSIGFSEGRFNELEYARLAARHFGANHAETILSPAHAMEAIPKIVAGYDEPFANSSAIPTYWCARLAKERGKDVMLAGDGGDELFGGNERYRTDQVYQLYQRIPRALRKLMEPALFAVPELGIVGKAQRYVRRSNVPNPTRYCEWRLLQVFTPTQVLGSAMPSLNGNLLAVMRGYYESAPARSELNRLLYIDIKMTLGDEDLPKVVRASELAGINVRFPYLDYPLVEFSGRLPSSLKVHGLEKRYLFKRATQNLLPREILKKKKHGFGLPIGMWLKTDPGLRALSRDVLLDPKTYQRGYFQRAFVERLMAELERDNTPYFGDLLWVFLILELWHRTHMEGAAR